MKACPFCGKNNLELKNPYGDFYMISCLSCGFGTAVQIGIIERWNTRFPEDSLRAELEAWKADAARLANYANHQTDSLNHVCGIYKKPRQECDCGILAALEAHRSLVERSKS